MGAIRSFRDLVAWRLAVEIAVEVYQLSASFPPDERFGLALQVRRASVSIASNIAEDFGRGPGRDFVRFLRVARGSLYEVETHIHIASRLGYLTQNRAGEIADRLGEAGRVLAGLIRSAESRGSPES